MCIFRKSDEGGDFSDDAFSYGNYSSVYLDYGYSSYDSDYYDEYYGGYYDYNSYSYFDDYYSSFYDFRLSFTSPSSYSTSTLKSQVSLWDLDRTLYWADQGYYSYSRWSSLSLDSYRNSMGFSSSYTYTDLYRYRTDFGDLGAPSSYYDRFKWMSDPVDVINGEFYIDAADLTLPGAMPLEIRRSYGSHNLSDNQFGIGWKLSYFPFLVVSTNAPLIFAAEMDGSVVAYRQQTNDIWRPEPIDNPQLKNQDANATSGMHNLFNARIEMTVDGAVTNYLLFSPDGSVRTFLVESFPVGSFDRTRPYLKKWEDNRGNYYDFSFGTNSTENDFGQVCRIRASSGASVNFNYDAYGHITEAYTGDGRHVYYSYNDDGDLVGVTLPDASEVHYEYSTGPVTNTFRNITYGWVYHDYSEYDWIGDISAPSTDHPKETLQYSQYHSSGDGNYVSSHDGSSMYYSYNFYNESASYSYGRVRYQWSYKVERRAFTVPGWHQDGYWRYENGYWEPEVYVPFYTSYDWYIPRQYIIVHVSGYFWEPTEGTGVSYGLGSTHLLTAEIKPDGRVLQNQYDDQGRVTNQLSTVGPDLTPIRNASFFYYNDYQATNSYTNRVSGYTLVEDIFGNTYRHDYTNSLITQITDPLLQTVVNDWYQADETNKAGYATFALEMSKDKRGLWTKNYYDTNGNLLTNVVLGDLTGGGRAAADQTEAEYYAENPVAPGQVERVLTTYTYLDRNRISTIVDASGVTTAYHYDDTNYPFLPTRSIVSASGMPVLTNVLFYTNSYEIVNNGGAMSKTNQSFGLLWRQDLPGSRSDWILNGRGFAKQEIRYTGTADPDVVNDYLYNDRGEMVQESNSLRIISHAYDGMGRPIWKEIRDPGSAVPMDWVYNYYNENGELTWRDGARFDPEDYVWWDYDGAGRPITEIHWRSQAKADGSGVEAVPGYDLYASSFKAYDGFGNLIRSIDPLGNTTTNAWDAIGQMVQQVRLDGDDSVLSSEGFAYEPGGLVSAHTNAEGGVTLKSYTSTGKLKRQENPDGTVIQWTYYLDGRLQREYQPNDNYWETVYDDAHRLIKRTFSADVANSETKVFDARGNLVITTNAVGAVFTNLYDGLNRIKIASGPPAIPGVSARQTSSYTYDNVGRTLSTANALGEKTITTHDTAGRPISVEVRAPDNSLVKITTTSYATNHNSVTTSTGDSANTITNTVYTDTFDKPVLTRSFPASGSMNYTLKIYDAAGNLTSTRDELNQVTTFAYDAANRLRTNTLPDGAEIALEYSANDIITNRTMPGGLTWSALYDDAGRILSEKETGGGLTARSSSYQYYASGQFVGLLWRVTDARGIDTDYTYDALRRLVNVDTSGSLPEYQVHQQFTYDRRDLVTRLDQYANDQTVEPLTSVLRSYDNYGQVYDEQVQVGGLPLTHLVQNWDAAGRRTGLGRGNTVDSQGLGLGGNYTYTYRADNLMASLNANGQSYNFSYGNNGLLTSRSNPFRTVTVNQRDGQGRIKQQTTTVGANTPLVESLDWRANSTLDVYTAQRSDFTDVQDYGYNLRGQLTNDTLKLTASLPSVNTGYEFDSSKLGVLVSSLQSGGQTNRWQSGPLDGLSRLLTSTDIIGELGVRARGFALGAGSVDVALDGSGVGVSFDTNSGLWHADLSLTAGSHALVGTANSWHGILQKSVTNTFLVQNQVTGTNSYDLAGNITTRSYDDGRIQYLSWDAMGRLLRMTEVNGSVTNYVWSAVYDGLGRRLRTVYNPGGTNSASSLTINSWFDPQVEFLELAVEVGGQRTWKVTGPDLDGIYGGMQGVGGLEITLRERDGLITPVLNDYFGNVQATISGSQVNWNQTRVNGWGPVRGYQAPTLTLATPLAETLVWRSRRLDPSGFYCLGARYYDPSAGRFLSPDPLGHEASMDLYSFCNNDPINSFDPDGRLVKSSLMSTFHSYYNGGVTSYGLRTLGSYLDNYNNTSGFGGWVTGFSSSIVNLLARGNAPSSYVDGLRSYTHNVASYYDDGGLLPAASYATTSWNVGAIYSGFANFDLHYDTAGQPIGDWYERGAVISGGVANSALIGAGGLWGAARLGFVPPTPLLPGSSLWENRFPGVQVRQVGGYWVKRVNPQASEVMQAWGRQTIKAQAEGLETLRAAGRPAANSRLFDSGRLVVENVGTPLSTWNYLNPQYWRAWCQDTRALGTPLNDLRPGNYGPGFRAFDPALDPIQAGLIGGTGIGIYYGVGRALAGGNQ